MVAFEPIIEQLKNQNIQFEILQKEYDNSPESILSETIKSWIEKFIGDKTAPYLNRYLWHIFSYDAIDSFKGQNADLELSKQFETDSFIFNESQQYLIKCNKRIPKILMEGYHDDIYICHHNMKWTYVIPHEVHHGFGPYFSYGNK